jgi:hypothetical protein
MKKTVIALIVLLQFLSISAFADIVANQKGKCGYTDENGTLVIPHKYDFIGQFNENGVARVRKGEKQGLVSTTGEEVLPCVYDLIDSFDQHGLAVITKGKVKGVVSSNGSVILKPSYTEISKFNGRGHAWVSLVKGKKTFYGIINKDGQFVIPCSNLFIASYDATKNKDITFYLLGTERIFTAGNVNDTLSSEIPYFIGGTDVENYSIYALDGTKLLSTGIDEAIGISEEEKAKKIDNINYGVPSENIIPFAQSFKNSKKYFYVTGYYDLIEKRTIASYVTETSLKAYNKSKKDRKDFDKEWNEKAVVLSTNFSNAHATIFKTDNGIVKTNVINKDGVIVGSYDACSYYKDGYMVVGDKKLGVGLVDLQGNFIIPYKYSDANNVVIDNRLIVKQNKWGVVDLTDQIVVPLEFDTIHSVYNTSVVVKDNKYGIYIDSTMVVPCIFRNITLPTNYNPKYILVFDEKWRIYDIKNQNLKEGRSFENLVSADEDKILGYDVVTKELNGKTITDTLYCLINYDAIDLIPYGLTSLEQVGMAYDMCKDLKPGTITEIHERYLKLYLSRSKRRYSVKEVISEEDWDY